MFLKFIMFLFFVNVLRKRLKSKNSYFRAGEQSIALNNHQPIIFFCHPSLIQKVLRLCDCKKAPASNHNQSQIENTTF